MPEKIMWKKSVVYYIVIIHNNVDNLYGQTLHAMPML
jgi:hypothetical protein